MTAPTFRRLARLSLNGWGENLLDDDDDVRQVTWLEAIAKSCRTAYERDLANGRQREATK